MTLLRIEPANPLNPALIRRRSALGTIGALSVAGRASVGGLGILLGDYPRGSPSQAHSKKSR